MASKNVVFARPNKGTTIQGICTAGTAYIIVGHSCPTNIHGGGKVTRMWLDNDVVFIEKDKQDFGSFSSAANRIMTGDASKNQLRGKATAVHVSNFLSVIVDGDVEAAKQEEPAKPVQQQNNNQQQNRR